MKQRNKLKSKSTLFKDNYVEIEIIGLGNSGILFLFIIMLIFILGQATLVQKKG